MKLLLKLKIKNYDTLVLYFPPLVRVLLLAISVFAVSGIYLFPADIGEAGSDIIPLSLGAVSLACASYSEKWVFDRADKTVKAKTSFLVFSRKSIFAMEEISDISYSRIVKRRIPESSFHKLSIQFRNGMVKDIEIVPSKDSAAGEKKAETIADFCSVNFRNDQGLSA